MVQLKFHSSLKLLVGSLQSFKPLACDVQAVRGNSLRLAKPKISLFQPQSSLHAPC